MTAREAREFFKKFSTPGSLFLCDDPRTFNVDFERGRSDGFLEAVEKFKPVVEALKKYADPRKPIAQTYSEIAQKALEQYCREVLGE